MRKSPRELKECGTFFSYAPIKYGEATKNISTVCPRVPHQSLNDTIVTYQVGKGKGKDGRIGVFL